MSAATNPSESHKQLLDLAEEAKTLLTAQATETENLKKLAASESGKRVAEIEKKLEKMQERFVVIDEAQDKLRAALESSHKTATTTRTERTAKLEEVHAGSASYYMAEKGKPVPFDEFAMQHRVFPACLTVASDLREDFLHEMEQRHGQGSPEVEYARRTFLAIDSGTATGDGGAVIPPAYTEVVWQTARLKEPIMAEVFEQPITTKRSQRRLTTENVVRWYSDDSAGRGVDGGTGTGNVGSDGRQNFYNQELSTNAAVVHLQIGEELVEDYPASFESVIRDTVGMDLGQALGRAVVLGNTGDDGASGTRIGAFDNNTLAGATSARALSPRTSAAVHALVNASGTSATAYNGDPYADTRRFRTPARVITGASDSLGASGTVTAGQSTASGTADAKLEELFASIKVEYRSGAVLLMSRRTFAAYAALKDSDGALLYRDWAVQRRARTTATSRESGSSFRNICPRWMTRTPPPTSRASPSTGTSVADTPSPNGWESARGCSMWTRRSTTTTRGCVAPEASSTTTRWLVWLPGPRSDRERAKVDEIHIQIVHTDEERAGEVQSVPASVALRLVRGGKANFYTPDEYSDASRVQQSVLR